MSSYLIVPFFLCCALSVVQSAQQGVLAKLLLDLQCRLLQPPFLGSRVPFLLLFPCFRLIVGEEVELYGRVLPLSPCLVLTDDVVDGDVEPPDEQDRVDNAVVEIRDGMDDLLRGRRGMAQCLRAVNRTQAAEQTFKAL